MSLGSQEDDPALKMAVDHAYNQGVLIVSAAGNDFDETVENGGCNNNVANDCVDYPAAYSSVIAVGAVDENENHAYFSSTGPEVEVSAPGVGIVSTYLNGQYAYMSGTSMATPYVAGELALLKQEFPEKTVVQIRKLLTTDVIDLGKTGHDNIYGYGFIQSPDLLSITSPTSLFINRLENETQRISSGKYLIKSISNEWYQIFDDNGQIRWAKPGYVKNITSLTITKPTSLFIDKNGNETERLSTGTYKIYQKYSDGWFKIYNNKGQIRWAKPGFVKEKAIYHIVIKGETLYSISKKFSVSVDSIKNLNKLKTNVIKVGQNLRIK
jgi:subtilisin family serine protease